MPESEKSPARSATLVNRLSLVVAVVVILAGLGTVAALKFSGSPLKGASEHDFGVVPVDGARTILEHTFQLTNPGRHTVDITNITSSCGCTAAEPSQRSIGPGGSLDLATTLKLAGSGLKRSNIKLVLDIEGKERVQTLWIQAVGRRTQPLTVTREQLDVRPGETARFSLALEAHDASEPAPPQLEIPDGVQATWGGWRPTRSFNKKTMRPGVWKSQVSVDLVGESLAPNSKIVVSAAGGEPVAVQLELVTGDGGGED